MKILFHVGSGNTDRPERWWGVCVHFSNLARSFEALGHECVLHVHPAAKSENIYYNHITSDKATRMAGIENFTPDVLFIWNGISPGDEQMVSFYPNAIKVYCELGFFDHYSTVYFDFSGTNAKSQNLIDELKEPNNISEYFRIRKKQQKPQLESGRYVFVALQDEQDTQITKYSPFKTMNEVMQYASDITKCYGDDIKILYKQHPMAPCNITIKDSRFKEVTEDVHHYLKDAELVIGCNSSVLFETLLYHNRILTLGLGLTSRMIGNECTPLSNRVNYLLHCYEKQVNQAHLGDPDHMKETWMYKTLMEKYNEA